MKLTAQDLQIGDWVVYNGDVEYCYPIKVEGMDVATDSLITTDRDDVGFDGVWPIPITPEILDKNGFEKIEEKNYATPILEKRIESINVLLGERQHYVKIVVDSQVGNETEFFTFLGKAKYVHQLQQAMRLCKIRKEIEL